MTGRTYYLAHSEGLFSFVLKELHQILDLCLGRDALHLYQAAVSRSPQHKDATIVPSI